MSYIGNEPIVSTTRTVTEITATAGQTTFTANGGYTVGFIDVFVNGAQLQSSDFTATNGSTVVLTNACAVGDDVRLVAYGTFQTSSALTANNPSYTGTLTGGTGVVNIGSGQIYKDASGNVGIGTTSPAYRVDVVNNSTGTQLNIASSSSNGTSLQLVSTSTNGRTYRIGSNFSTGTGELAFYDSTAGAERMRIDSSGNLLVGTTTFNPASGVAGLSIGSTASLSAGGWGIIYGSTSTANSYAAYFKNPNGAVGSIITNGSSTAYNTSSDYRLKENIAPMQNALSVVQQLKPVTYNWKADGSDGQGFIAHELQEVVPDCVTGEKDAVDAEGNPVYQGIDTSFLVATLTKAIQEQQAQIEELKAKVNALENK